MRDKNYYTSKIARQKARTGFVFSIPVIFGVVVFFCIPLAQSLVVAFSNVSPNKAGGGLVYNPAGWSNFLYAFTNHPDYFRKLVEAIQTMVTTVPIILFKPEVPRSEHCQGYIFSSDNLCFQCHA